MEHVLVIEDDVNIRETLRDVLELSGYKVSLAENGKVGYDIILENQPDLVLCDINMPVLNGFDLLHAINDKLKDEIIPPFLFLTAKVEKEDIRHGLDLGADDYILKPFNNTDVLAIIRMRLDKRNSLFQHHNAGNPKNDTDAFNKLALPCADGLELVAFDKIIKCQADRAYCHFFLADGKKILVSKPMKEFEEVLLSQHFFKVHKSTIVNINFIDKYVRGKNGSLMLSDGSVVPVSPLNKDKLLQILNHTT